MIVSAIVAASTNDIIGKDGELPWHLPADLKYFKRKTLGHHVIMGRKTFRLLGKPLPKRTNIVLTRDPMFLADGILIAHSMYEALELAHDAGEEEAFVIGGAQVYAAALPYLDKIYLTRVEAEVEGDTALFRFGDEDWDLTTEDAYEPDEAHEYGYRFLLYEKKPTNSA